MKKRIAILFCALALLVSCLVVSSMAAENQNGYCQYCKETVDWEPVAFGEQKLPEGQTSVHKHYYLDQTYTHTSDKQISLPAGVTVCLDLNGCQWNAWGRAFNSNAGSTLNVMDSKSGGAVTCTSATGASNASGGVGYIRGTMNIYGGAYSLKLADENNLYTTRGGIFNVTGGVVNLYDGTLNGAKVSGESGAVFLDSQGQFNAYGGTVTAGISTGGKGGCIGVNSSSCIVRLGGDAEVAEIRYYWHKKASLVVEDGYTGKANILFDKTVDKGTVVGVCNGDISGAQILCTNGSGFSVVADGAALKLGQLSAATVLKPCAHCDQTVNWTAFDPKVGSTLAAGTYHFYLAANYGVDATGQVGLNAGVSLCLDLNGKSFTTNGRAINVKEKATLNVMDSVGGGSINGTSAGNNPGGGTVNVGYNATLNLYSGTLTFTRDDTTTYGTGRGGVIANSGTVNMYGGKIIGGDMVDSTYESFNTVDGVGGAIYSTGTLNLLGGQITSGSVPESGAGPCVYLTSDSGNLLLGGDAKVEDIYFTSVRINRFTVNSDYTGTAGLSFDPAIALHQGMELGVCDTESLEGEITCTDPSYPMAMPSGGKLVLTAYAVGTAAVTGGQTYATLPAALEAAADGALVELMKSYQGDLQISKNVCLQLNGFSINGTVTVAEGCTLYGIDAATDDFSVADGKYGRITKVVGDVSGAVPKENVSEDNYLKIQETDGISFHCVRLQIHTMTLRVSSGNEPGLYYKSHFLADEKAAPQLTGYGVALSLNGDPNADNLESECGYTRFEGFENGPYGNIGNSSSTLLKGVLQEKYGYLGNLKNMDRPVYGRAYATTTDGQYLFGKTVSRSLHEQLVSIDQLIPKLSETQVDSLMGMYNAFRDVLSGFSLTGIEQAVQNEEKGTLKVLSLGHSHGLDGTTLLYEVFDKELTDQEVVVGALYYSGCSMAQHANFLTNNSAVYDYYKWDGTGNNGAASLTKNATALHALQDEQWDVIVIQDANFLAGQEVSYDADTYMTVINYLYNNQEMKPRLLFHMTWTNPDDYNTYINANSTLSHPNQGWYRPYMEQHYSDENGVYQREILIDKILSFSQTYLEDCTDFLGEKHIESVIPAATAVEYAQYVLGRTDAEIYRDWTHMNDYGRLMVAYCWYAKIMNLDSISQVNVNEVPKGVHNDNSKYPADLKFDANMKEDLIEAVNFALANPYLDIANGDPLPEK